MPIPILLAAAMFAQQPAAPQPLAEQVAAAVDREFAAYDADGDGRLDEAEFGRWMVALKRQTDPAVDADAPATQQWNRAAFAHADADRNRSLTKAELNGFFVPEDAG